MHYQYEFIKHQEGLPIKIFFQRINRNDFHWHNEMELIFVLKGSVQINIGKLSHVLCANDLIILNSNETHSTQCVEGDNILLVLQIDTEFSSAYFPELKYMKFNCNSTICSSDRADEFDFIRHLLADIIWEMNKKMPGYPLSITGQIHSLLTHLIRNFEIVTITNEHVKVQENVLDRLQRIMDYVKENYMNKISLKEMADREYLNLYYFSHFFKEKMGITFQEYLNDIRLENAEKELVRSDQKISDISYACGFANTKSLNKSFRDKHDMTPSEFRKKIQSINSTQANENHRRSKVSDSNDRGREEQIQVRSYLDFEPSKALELLLGFTSTPSTPHSVKPQAKQMKSICVSAKAVSSPYEPTWNKLITFGRAEEGLRAKWQNQLSMLQSELNFEFIRFHGIFNDDMMVVSNKGGAMSYNWKYVDELLDFLVSLHLKPFIELGMMPDALKRSDETIFYYRSNIAPPREIGEWTELVECFIRHLINRYGQRQVESWRFEVWNEPDIEGGFWAGSKQEYFDFYHATAMAVKGISPKLQVGGPAIVYLTIMNTDWLQTFFEFCIENDTPIDFVSYHIYPEKLPENMGLEKLSEAIRGDTVPTIANRYYGINHNSEVVGKVESIMKDDVLPVHITEWNASSNCRNLIHDTAYMGTYVIRENLRLIGKVDSLGFWTFTDIFEEFGVSKKLFHGGFGMLTDNGLKKPSYNGYKLMSHLGDRLLHQGDYYMITKSEKGYQILIYNYAYFDNLYLSGEHSGITEFDRYGVFEETGVLRVDVTLDDLKGTYKLTTITLDQTSGSIFDAWIEMGAPDTLSEEERIYLESKSQMNRSTAFLTLDDGYRQTVDVNRHGAILILLESKEVE